MPDIGRFFNVDPLAEKYAYNGVYNFSENRVIDGRELEGLEYISVHHYANGAVSKTEYYKMSNKQIRRLGGTTAGIHNSVAYGSQGRGIVHYYYNDNGDVTKTQWEQRQTGGRSDFVYHGLYSGPGCITYDGSEGSTNYNFDAQPIDWADAIAKRHDMDYADATKEGGEYAGYLEDVRTLQADKDMVERVDDITAAFLNNPFAPNEVDGVETPVRTSYSTEMYGTLLGQRVLINALATYKQWKIDNNLGNGDIYQDNRDAFSKAHPTTAKILDQL